MGSQFTFSGIDHVGLTARDMDATIHFYRDLLGLTMVCDVEMAHSEGRAPGIFAMPHERRRFVLFETGGGPNLTINSHPGDDLAGTPLRIDDAGLNHVSLVVSDLAALTERLLAAGVQSPGPGWFIDPDGTYVQFEEPGHSAAGLARMLANARLSEPRTEST